MWGGQRETRGTLEQTRGPWETYVLMRGPWETYVLMRGPGETNAQGEGQEKHRLKSEGQEKYMQSWEGQEKHIGFRVFIHLNTVYIWWHWFITILCLLYLHYYIKYNEIKYMIIILRFKTFPKNEIWRWQIIIFRKYDNYGKYGLYRKYGILTLNHSFNL